MASNSSTYSLEELECFIKDWDHLQRLKIPQETYNETYNELHDQIKAFIHLLLPGIAGGIIRWPLIKIIDLFRSENPMPLDKNTTCVNLNSNENLKEMADKIIRYSKPNYSEEFAKKTKSNDLRALKNYVRDTANLIATNYVIPKSTVTLFFTKSIIAILEEVERTRSEEEINIKKNNNSFDVNRNGSIVIADYTYTFCGKVSHDCCWGTTHDVNLKIKFKVWKFPNAAHLKNEFDRFIRL